MTLHLSNAQLAVAKRLMVNAGSNPFTDTVGSVWWGGAFSSGDHAKHNLFYDFGYPKIEELTFYSFYYTWRRNGFATSLVEKTAGKTWQTNPCLLEQEEAHEETAFEAELRQHLDRMRFWQMIKQADERSMVGKYAGVILQLGDGQAYDQPVKSVPGGIRGLVSVIPAWEAQLEPSAWEEGPWSPNYGKPTMFRFNESAVNPENNRQMRSFSVHPDRVIVWSEDGNTWGESKLEPCYNALMDMEKVRGAGGEGFWKNAKAQPVLQADKEIDFNSLAKMLGTDLDGLPDALDEQLARWAKGFDQGLVLQGMEAKTLGVQLPTNPDQYFNVALQEVAASWPIPQKILVGMQTGERASTEDAREWAQTNMSRRANIVIPNIMELIYRLERWGILPDRDWFIDWEDLTAPTLEEKLAIGEKMAKVNQAMFATGDVVFTDDEIRDVAGYEKRDEVGLTELDFEEGEDDAG